MSNGANGSSWLKSFLGAGGSMMTAVVVLLFGLALIAVFVMVGMPGTKTHFGLASLLILVALAGFTLLLLHVAGSLHAFGMLDRTQAFALPPGTVRAILTLAFIVLVGVFGSLVLLSTGERKPYALIADNAGTMSAAEAAALAARMPADVMVVQRPTAGGVQVSLYARSDHSAADDTAKQVLAMLSTLLAAMIGFYFGSRGSEDSAGSRADGGAPTTSEIGAIRAILGESADAGVIAAALRELRPRIEASGSPDRDRDLAAIDQALRDLEAAQARNASIAERLQGTGLRAEALKEPRTEAEAGRDVASKARELRARLDGQYKG